MSQSFMPLNMDYSKTVMISAADQQWIGSPVKGVIRCQFEREQSESGWATSLVRYTPGTQFPHHLHSGGEQIYILDGIFSDNTGDFPADTYIQNPIDSIHSPHSKDGTLIFVRLGATEINATQQIIVHHFSTLPIPKIQTGTRDYLLLKRERHGNIFVKTNAEFLLLKGNLGHKSSTYAPLSWFRISAQDQLTFLAIGEVEYIERPLLR
jgi:ChrR Cupin-like domain